MAALRSGHLPAWIPLGRPNHGPIGILGGYGETICALSVDIPGEGFPPY